MGGWRGTGERADRISERQQKEEESEVAEIRNGQVFRQKVGGGDTLWCTYISRNICVSSKNRVKRNPGSEKKKLLEQTIRLRRRVKDRRNQSIFIQTGKVKRERDPT